MARLAKKQYLTLKDDQKFTQFLRKTRDTLSTNDRGLASPPTPYVYEFPYPKGPPAVSNVVIPLKEKDSDREESSEIQPLAPDISHLDSSSLSDKLLDDEEVLLSSALKDALSQILRDNNEGTRLRKMMPPQGGTPDH
jgi:hypothetical protein